MYAKKQISEDEKEKIFSILRRAYEIASKVGEEKYFIDLLKGAFSPKIVFAGRSHIQQDGFENPDYSSWLFITENGELKIKTAYQLFHSMDNSNDYNAKIGYTGTREVLNEVYNASLEAAIAKNRNLIEKANAIKTAEEEKFYKRKMVFQKEANLLIGQTIIKNIEAINSSVAFSCFIPASCDGLAEDLARETMPPSDERKALLAAKRFAKADLIFSKESEPVIRPIIGKEVVRMA